MCPWNRPNCPIFYPYRYHSPLMIHPDPESYHEIPHPSSLFLRQATEESNNHLNVFKNKYFVLKCLEDISPFCGATDTPVFWLLVMFALGFKACLCALLPAHNRILRFTSGATPADLLAASMAAKLFSPIYLWTSIGGAWDQDLSCVLLPHSDQADTPMTKLCWLGFI